MRRILGLVLTTLLVGCYSSVFMPEMIWRTAEHMCGKNGGTKSIKIEQLSSIEFNIRAFCYNGMEGAASIKISPEEIK